MRRLWIYGIALLSTAVMVSAAGAQSGARSGGSYQSILAQAGIQQGNGGFVPTQGGFGTAGAAAYGAGYGVNNPGVMQGGIIQSAPVSSSFSPGVISGPIQSGTVAVPPVPSATQGSMQKGRIPGTIEGTVQTSRSDATAATESTVGNIGVANGSVINGGVINGDVIDSSMGQYGVINGGAIGGGVIPDGAIGGQACADPGFAGAPVSPPVFTPGDFQAAPQFTAAPLFTAAPQFIPAPVGRNKNTVFGISGLIFDRDFEDDVYFSQNANGGVLSSTDADTGNLSGVETFFQSRNAGGTGFEARYWGLFNGAASASLGGSPRSVIPGLASVTDPTTGFGYYASLNLADVHTVTRFNEIHNVEFNFLKNMGVHSGSCMSSTNELFFGFRWFNFDENFSFFSNSTVPGYADSLRYDIDVENILIGLQAGGRSEAILTERLRFGAGLKAGLFNNRARSSQSLSDNFGTFGQVNGGEDFNFQDSKNDIAFLGELDFSLVMHVSFNARARIGYRAIGVSGVALSPDQIPLDFRHTPSARDTDTNGSLLLHGAYVGLEFAR